MESFLIYFLKSSGIIALFLLFYMLFLKRETFFRTNRIYLVIGLGLSLFLPFVVFTKTIWVEAMPMYQIQVPDKIMATNSIENPVDWNTLLLYGYFAGVLFFTFRFVVQLFSLKKLIGNGKKIKDGKFIRVETDQKNSPFSFFNYLVYNPTLHTAGELDTILIHEKIHAQGRHSADMLAMQLFTIFQWCNPFIWGYRGCLNDNLEYLADTRTIAQKTDKADYQHLLLRTGLGENRYSLVTPFFNTSIKKRIIMLNKNRSHRKNSFKYALILPLLAGFIILFNVKTEAQVKSSDTLGLSPDKKTRDIIQKIYSINKGTPDNELAILVNQIVQQGGELDIINLKRNEKGLISKIELSYKIDDQGKVSGNYKGSNGIATIYFGKASNGIFITSSKERKGVLLEGMPLSSLYKGMAKKETTTKSLRTYADGKTEENVVRRTYENGEEKLYLNGKETTMEELKQINIYLDGEVPSDTGVRKAEENSNIKNSETKLFLLDGKEVSKSHFENIAPETLESVIVLKAPKAIAKYGDKARDGAIEAKTKSVWAVGYGKMPSNPEKMNAFEGYQQMKNSNQPDIEKALIFIDEVESTVNDLKSLKLNRIESTMSIQPEGAIRRYGDKAKNGVIKFFTKK